MKCTQTKQFCTVLDLSSHAEDRCTPVFNKPQTICMPREAAPTHDRLSLLSANITEKSLHVCHSAMKYKCSHKIQTKWMFLVSERTATIQKQVMNECVLGESETIEIARMGFFFNLEFFTNRKAKSKKKKCVFRIQHVRF